MAKATKTIDGYRVRVTTLQGRVSAIEGDHLSVIIDTVDGSPAGPEHTSHTAFAGTTHERTTPLVYGTSARDKAGQPVAVKVGDPVTFILDEHETTFLETKVNGIITQSYRW